jgi:rubrerythrin
MSTAAMSEEILHDAVQKEELSRMFYRQLADRVSNPSLREPLLRMAEEEQRHKDLLLTRLTEQYHTEFTPRHIPGTEKYRVAEQEITDHEHVLVVFRTGMQLEDEAVDFYRIQLERVDDPRDLELLHELIEFEQEHRRWLEEEYRKLSTSSAHWLP